MTSQVENLRGKGSHLTAGRPSLQNSTKGPVRLKTRLERLQTKILPGTLCTIVRLRHGYKPADKPGVERLGDCFARCVNEYIDCCYMYHYIGNFRWLNSVQKKITIKKPQMTKTNDANSEARGKLSKNLRTSSKPLP